MIYKAKVIIATGVFQNITIELDVDTDNMKASKDVIKAFHKHFYGLLDRQVDTNNIINQLNRTETNNNIKYNFEADTAIQAESELDN